MNKPDGGLAFPGTRIVERHQSGLLYDEGNAFSDVTVSVGGMSLRDYFAAHALRFTLGASTDRDGAYDYVAAAIGAYMVADAMLTERSSKGV